MKLNPKYPVFANTPPWNALILLGSRTFKTMGFPWKYRGPVYLYDSRSVNSDTQNYGFEWAEEDGISERRLHALIAPGKIVGTVEIVGIRRGLEWLAEYEVLLANPRKFKKPIAFNWPRGAVRIARVGSK